MWSTVVPSVAAYCAVVIVSLKSHSIVVYLKTFCDFVQARCVPLEL